MEGGLQKLPESFKEGVVEGRQRLNRLAPSGESGYKAFYKANKQI